MALFSRVHNRKGRKPKQPGAKTSWYEEWVENWWLAEISIIFCSWIFVSLLCILLACYDNRSVPSFGHYFNTGINLGTVVSLLMMLAVVSAMKVNEECIHQLKWLWYSRGGSRSLHDLETYDRASRGFWGSLALIWKLRLSHPTASFGALLMITHLALFPLAQQSLTYVSQSIPDTRSATSARIPWALSYSDNRQPTEGVSLGMQIAILNGFIVDPRTALNSTQPTCSSGNCTFPDYHSLAVCATTADVTSSLNMTAIVGAENYCLPGDFCLSRSNISSQDPGETMNNTAIVMSAAKTNAHGNNTSPALNFTSISFSNHVSPIADGYVIYHKDGHQGAVEFVLDWCVAKFSTNVVNNTAVTTQHADPFMSFTLDGANLSAILNGSWYGISAADHFDVQSYFQQQLNGIMDAFGSIMSTNGSSPEIVRNLITGLWEMDSPDGLNVSGKNPPEGTNLMLENVATSMSNYVRSSHQNAASGNSPGIPSDTFADSNQSCNYPYVCGTESIQQSIVVVSWGWIAAPIISLYASVVLLILTILASRRRLPIWKSSYMAAIQCAGPELQQLLGGILPTSKMTEKTRDVMVTLVQEQNGWRLVQTKREL